MRTPCVVPDVEVVGVSITEDTIKGYPSRIDQPRDMSGGGFREEEPRELAWSLGPLDSKPPIMACPRHVEAVDEARYVAGNLGEEVYREVIPWPR